MMMMLLIAVGVGFFFFMRKKAPGTTAAAPPTMPGPAQLLAGAQGQFSAREEPQYTSVTPAVNPNVGVILDPYTLQGKAQLPIISGSVVSRDPYLFTPQSAGMCQCNDQTCCYYAPFYEKHAYEQLPGPETRECRSVLYGDQFTACQDAVTAFQQHYSQELKTSYARAHAAHDITRHLAARPAKAYLHSRLASVRTNKMFGF